MTFNFLGAERTTITSAELPADGPIELMFDGRGLHSSTVQLNLSQF